MATAAGLGELGPVLLRPAWSATRATRVCLRCRRKFATSPILQSGHNKWSTIRHHKGKKDQIKSAVRMQYVEAITLYSRMYGPDVKTNSALANAIAIAKKSSMPKDVIEQAVARGQGRSLTGTALESMKFEVMMAPSVAFILEVETDNKLRALQDLGVTIRKLKGRMTATEFFFSRRGRVVYGKHATLDTDDMLDDLIELGAEDVETDDEGNVVVWCQPSQTMQVAQGGTKKFGVNILSSDIIWSPNEETRSTVESLEDVKLLAEFTDAVKQFPEVQAIYCNATKGDGIPEEEWADFEENVDS